MKSAFTTSGSLQSWLLFLSDSMHIIIIGSNDHVGTAKICQIIFCHEHTGNEVCFHDFRISTIMILVFGDSMYNCLEQWSCRNFCEVGAKKLNSARCVAMAMEKFLNNANGPSNHHTKFEIFLIYWFYKYPKSKWWFI